MLGKCQSKIRLNSDIWGLGKLKAEKPKAERLKQKAKNPKRKTFAFGFYPQLL
jgi:hypothetical protein